MEDERPKARRLSQSRHGADGAADQPSKQLKQENAEAGRRHASATRPNGVKTGATAAAASTITDDKPSSTAAGPTDPNDSEDDTDVQEENRNPKAAKAIKLEDPDSSARLFSETADGATSATGSNGKSIKKEKDHASRDGDESPRQSLKRKRGRDESHTAEQHETQRDSSALSSTASSPAPQTSISAKTRLSSEESQSSSIVVGRHTHSTRRRAESAANGRDRRDTRSATYEDDSSHKSESPGASKGRARSTPSLQRAQKRRRPAPLHVDKNSKNDDVHDSDDSSVHSHPRLAKLQSADAHIASPAKVSVKKNRDRNGRTLLARACTQSYEEAEKWLKERPQDIDEPDNAGNTPLQIASLAGFDDVVSMLLKAGCDTNCKNIDLDTPLIDAVENSHVAVVKLLLKAGVDPRQRNAKGQEPLELVDADDEDGEEIRRALLQSRRDDGLRRHSEDHRQHHDIIAAFSPTDSTRSPPPTEGFAGRRKTGRSLASGDNLLWINPTPQRLQEAAAKGDLSIVDHILKMRPDVPNDAMVAAVKGGHADVLGIMTALGKFDPNPLPSKASEYGAQNSTPMLAAIGRGNLTILEIVAEMEGFDPTKRVWKGMSYIELAEERKGEDWEEEVKVLQRALDRFKPADSKSSGSSPQRSRVKRPAKKSPEPTPPTIHEPKKRKPTPSAKEAKEVKDVKETKQTKEDPAPEPEPPRRRPTYQGTAARRATEEGDRSNRMEPPKTKGDSRSGTGDSASRRDPSLKLKRKLLSGNDVKSDRTFSKSSSTDMPSAESGGGASNKTRARRSSMALSTSSAAESTDGKTTSEDASHNSKDESSRKRHRTSASPQPSPSANEPGRKKRPRVSSDAEVRNDAQKPTQGNASKSSESPASITKSPLQGAAAPVAFMGGSSATLKKDTTEESKTDTTASRHGREIKEEADVRMEDVQKPQASEVTNNSKDRPAEQERQQHKEERSKAKETEKQQRKEAARAAEEAEAKARAEREADEARQAKAKRDEDLQRRRAEEDKQRKEDQDRRRREREEKERQRRVKQREDEHRARMEALPNGLRRALEIGVEGVITEPKEITKWLPLRTATTRDLDPACADGVAGEQWLANVQAAPILASQDLELSQYTAWNRLAAKTSHIESLWRQLRNPMSVAVPSAFLSWREAVELDTATKPKFFALKVSWIKLADFMDIVPRYPHLSGLALSVRPMVLDHQLTLRKGSGFASPLYASHQHPQSPGHVPAGGSPHGIGVGSPRRAQVLVNGASTNGR